MRETPTTTRRTLLTATGTLTTLALAGCSSGSGDDADPTTTRSTTTTAEPTTTTTQSTTTQADAGDVDREVTVESESFTFTPGSDEPLRLNAGETVRLTATAVDDGLGQGHGLGIPELDVNLYPLLPDEPKSTVFTPEEPGEYVMLCTIQCSQPGAGEGHNNMRGTVVVE